MTALVRDEAKSAHSFPRMERTGPKPFPKARKRSEKFLVALRPAEAQELRRVARKANEAPTAFARELILEAIRRREGDAR